ncbi:MAG: hypothetical protein M1838_003464 [Thelocarpon superellum]|nr:MAG: hypothetical protein M1838_003464 [Thelocarpon superellum]
MERRRGAQAQLVSALRIGEPNRLLRAVRTAVDDASLIKSIPRTTFTEILRALDPQHFIEPYKRIHKDMSPATVSLIEAKPIRVLFAEFVSVIGRLAQTRREAGWSLGIADYTLLLKCAEAVGNGTAAETLWHDMKRDGIAPDTPCYNHYISARCWSGASDPSERHHLRVTPHHLKMRNAPHPPKGFAGYKIGEGGIKQEVGSVLQEMVDRGVVGDETTYSTLITAMAREGDVSGIKAVLKQVWQLDIDEEAPGPPPPLAATSPLHPTSTLLYAIAHGLGSNNDIPLALKAVDTLSRAYDVAIPIEIWETLLEWTFVLSIPRRKSRRHDGTATGLLPLQSVQSLWTTMTSAPYHIRPSMAMYNVYIKNLFLRGMPRLAEEQMQEGLRLYLRGRSRPRVGLGEGAESGPARLERRRNALYIRRWVRLLLGTRAALRSEAYNWERRAVPDLIGRWHRFLPKQVAYRSSGGRVGFGV